MHGPFKLYITCTVFDYGDVQRDDLDLEIEE